MREFRNECIDLIATDPPFNSKRDYFVSFRDEHGQKPDTLVRAFTDTWRWGDAAEDAYRDLIVDVGGQVADTIQGLRQFLNETPMMAYLVMMCVRIVEMHRILKPTGSLYLHCDPTASHYLKIVLDAVFGTGNFRNEIIWCYQTGGVSKRWFGRKHDVIHFYTKTEKYFIDLTRVKESRTAEVLRRLQSGNENATRAKDLERLPFDVWNIQALNAMANERTGYPTQKPIELYKRIVAASSNEGDLVLDPFCGCGTTLMAAEELNRHWIGIDLTYLAIGAVRQQIARYFPQLRNNINIAGTPENREPKVRGKGRPVDRCENFYRPNGDGKSKSEKREGGRCLSESLSRACFISPHCVDNFPCGDTGNGPSIQSGFVSQLGLRVNRLSRRVAISYR